LPDVEALSRCPEDELLKLWEGLGYYNRVRNLKEAAIQVMETYGGAIPADYGQLLKLKGIGHYTAGAIASIAFKIPVPAVDGNVLRVLTRLTEDDTDIMKQSFRTQMEEELKKLMESPAFAKAGTANLPGAFNQALMELGAMVCLPNGEPLCKECPWQEICLAKKNGRINELPVKRKAKERRIENKTVLILRDGDKVAIQKRPKTGLLAGLYELPNVEGVLSPEETLLLTKKMGYAPLRIEPLGEAKHIFSHVEWHMTGYAVLIEEPEEANAKTKKQPLFFVEAAEAKERYAIPSAFAAYAGYMNIQLGNNRFE
jgi:A/G-specific adenine glycosylase